MDEQRAREILNNYIDGGDLVSQEVSYDCGDSSVDLAGDFTADQLEAVVWWMRNKSPGGNVPNKPTPAPPIPPGPRKISENPPKWPERQCCGCGVKFSRNDPPGPPAPPPFSCGKPECDKVRDNHPINNMVA